MISLQHISIQKTHWNKKLHEAGVERFYSPGVEKYGEFHGGYLNFGLWGEGITHYVQAAENLVRHLGNILQLNTKSRLLDVACGMGAQDIFLYKIFGCRIEALDATWKHVQCTAERILREGVEKKIHIQHGSATALPFVNETFTHLLSIEGPEHFKTRELFFGEACRVLKKRGVMVLADFILQREPRNLREHLFVEAVRKLWHVPPENYDSFASYRQKLQRQGFSNITIEGYGQKTIVGYYYEQKRKEVLRQVQQIRGYFVGWGSLLIDYLTYKAFCDGLIEYVLVRAEKR